MEPAVAREQTNKRNRRNYGSELPVLIVNGVGHLCQRQRPDPAKGPVQGYDPLSDSAQIGPPLIRRGIPGSL